MLTTSFALLTSFVVVLRALRNGWYAAHFAIVMGFAYLSQFYIGEVPEFTPQPVLWFLGIHLVVVNIVLFVMYGYDKHASRRGGWRIPEKTLHAFALIGGTISALYARKFFRHKTRKKSFIQMMWAVMFLQFLIVMILVFLVNSKAGY